MPSLPQVAFQVVLSAPVTALAPLPGTTFALAGRATDLLLLDVSSSGTTSRQLERWKIFERERVHRIIVEEAEAGRAWRGIVTGGREAVLVRVSMSDADVPTLHILASFITDDFIGDGAFLDNDLLLLSTLHNSLLIYRLPTSASSLPHSPSAPPVPPPLFAPVLTLHAPLRPLLWCSRFSRSHYHFSSSSNREGEEGEDAGKGQIRLAGGTMWGDAYLWDVATAGEIVKLVEEAERAGDQGKKEMRREGGLRRFVGHKGSIFTASFSPPSPSPSKPPRLLTASDDRTLRLFPLPAVFSPTVPLEEDHKPPIVEKDEAAEDGEKVLWGHEGRVWRAEWVDEGRIVSVGEDATLRLWTSPFTSLSSPFPPSATSSFSLTYTFRNGHDGRSMWSVVPTAKGEGVLTGGADGGVRYWGLPSAKETPVGREEEKEKKGGKGGKGGKAEKGGKVKSFVVAAVEGGGEVVAAVTLDGSFYVFPSPSSTSSPSILPLPSSLAKPLYASPSSPFAGASTSVSLSLLPLPPSQPSAGSRLRLVAMSNRGHVFSAVVSITTQEEEGAAVQVQVQVEEGSVVVQDLSIRATEVALLPLPSADEHEQDGRVRALVWDRASWALSVVDLPSPADDHTKPRLVANLPLSTLAPTALHFLSPSLFLVGFVDGGVALYALRSSLEPSTEQEIVQLAHLGGVDGDGVADIGSKPTADAEGGAAAWEVETMGRDGVRCLLLLSMTGDREGAVIEKVDERAVVKGSLEKILPDDRYLALSESRAVVFSSSGEPLYSFPSPGKKIPSQLVLHPTGEMSYYRLLSGQLHLSSLPSPSSPSAHSPPILLPSLHGREIRDVASLSLPRPDGRTLLAMGAENGAVSISELTDQNDLHTLYTNSLLPAALKSLAWTAAPSSASSSQSSYLLFASGARSYLGAFLVTPTPASLRVLPAGAVLGEEVGEEGEEVRCMGVGVVGQLPDGDQEAEEREGKEGETGIVAVYSDGSVKLWSHSLHPPLSSSCSSSPSSANSTPPSRRERGSFRLLASSTPRKGEKCILTVETCEVDVSVGEKRRVVVTGSSDGLLALRDVTPFLHPLSPPSVNKLRDLFFSLPHAHQSGINALALSTCGSTLTIATGGDDNALSIHRVQLSLDSSSSADTLPLQASLIGETVTVSDAHASTITGLSFLSPSPSPSPSILVSTSVDQRLNIWRHSFPPPPGRGELELVDSTCLSVADCGALDVLEAGEDIEGEGAGRKGKEGKKRVVVVVGIGAEVVELALPV